MRVKSAGGYGPITVITPRRPAATTDSSSTALPGANESNISHAITVELEKAKQERRSLCPASKIHLSYNPPWRAYLLARL